MIIRKPIWNILLVCLVARSVLAWEHQLNFSTYFDSNPRENIENKEPTYGLKARGLMRFEQESSKGRLYGSMLGQGFLEPALFLDSKVIFNGEVGGHYSLIRGYLISTRLQTFQKLYFDDLQRSGHTTVSGSIKRLKSHKSQQELGIRRTGSFIDYGSLFQYTEKSVYLKYTQHLKSEFQAVFTTQFGRVDYRDYLARILVSESMVLNGTDYQIDFSRMFGIHVKHLGKMIWGVSVNFEDINSNSATAESKIWAGKVYVSGRLSDQLFYHVMINGMKKYYAQPEILEATPYRDPEENIQNQLHIQLERVIHPSRVLYIQYSYIQNETIFNHWFYDKNLIETGIKVTL